MIDPYVDSEAGVLRNRLGITDPDQLKEIEAGISAAAINVLRIESLPGSYDLAHLQAFHRRIFGRLYPWAGEIRTVAIAKTDMFCLPQHIERQRANATGVLQPAGEGRWLDHRMAWDGSRGEHLRIDRLAAG